MIEKPQPDLLTLSTTFYELSVSRNLFSKAEIRQFGESGTEGLINEKSQFCEKQKFETSSKITKKIFKHRKLY